MLFVCIGLEAEFWFWKQEISKELHEEKSLIEFLLISQDKSDQPEELEQYREKILQSGRAVILYQCHFVHEELGGWLESLPDTAVRVPVGTESILMGCGNVRAGEVEIINQYLVYGKEGNLRHALWYMLKEYFGLYSEREVPPPEELPFDGIIEEGTVYSSFLSWHQRQEKRFSRYIGILIHRQNWIRDDLEAYIQLESALAGYDIGTVCVFSNGNTNCLGFEEIVEQYFSFDGHLAIEALVIQQILPVMPKEGRSIAMQSVLEFEALDIPVFRPVQSFYIDKKQWEESSQPLVEDISSGYMMPEMAGMTEPVLICTRDLRTQKTEVLQEQISYLASRIAGWLRLREKQNQEKKIVLMLHNAVCSGVEATIGKAFGMDAMESAVRILDELTARGYQTGNYPGTGRELFELIKEKKAFSDFRWTAAEDIAACGGCIYRLDADTEYGQYCRELPRELQESMEETWGPYPGEGMVLGRDLLVTGVEFGNVIVMVQPKRGCYGAKCTGEVCKILHDPLCPPTHQYLAVYRYLERVFGADAYVEIGTEGSLEFLPGKVNGLSEKCWPRIVLGSVPEIYLYHAGVPGEGTVAKRRGHALALTYLPAAAQRPDEETQRIFRLAGEYQKARELENGQEDPIREEILRLAGGNPAAARILKSADSFEEGIAQLQDASSLMKGLKYSTGLHVYGENPDEEEIKNYMEEARESTAGQSRPDPRQKELLRESGRFELDGLVNALEGRYISPGETGMPDENGYGILPTGRNLCGVRDSDYPGRLPYERGIELAEQLLKKYRQETGKWPEKVALNMISIDITRTGGEQLGEFLYLMGIRPVWDEKEHITGLEIIPLDVLKRPRIDVTVRISGVLRDTWPKAVRLMDEAVLLAASAEESGQWNFVRRHVEEYQSAYGEGLEREKTIRIFGDPPGGYGAGVDLALKASAWKEEKDLAKYFLQASAFAYGHDLDGQKKVREFADNMSKVEVSSDITQSPRMNLLSCGFSTQVQGGFRLAAKYLGGREIRQYQATSEKGCPVVTQGLDEKLEETIKETLLNPFWQEREKKNGYDGASEMMHSIQNVFDAQCLMGNVKDEILDKLAESYINDEEMREWMMEENPYAAEEIARRMLELVQRERWSPDEEVLESLKENYLIIEGDMEGDLESLGDIQAGNVDIITDREVEGWKEKLAEVEEWIK